MGRMIAIHEQLSLIVMDVDMPTEPLALDHCAVSHDKTQDGPKVRDVTVQEQASHYCVPMLPDSVNHKGRGNA